MFPSRRPSARTIRQCQTPPSKLSADSCPSLAPRSTGTRSSATRSAKRCKTLRSRTGSSSFCSSAEPALKTPHAVRSAWSLQKKKKKCQKLFLFKRRCDSIQPSVINRLGWVSGVDEVQMRTLRESVDLNYHQLSLFCHLPHSQVT